MAMKGARNEILVDGIWLTSEMKGVGRYGANVLWELSRHGSEDRYHVLVRDDRRLPDLPSGPRFHYRKVRYRNHLLHGLWTLPRQARSLGADLAWIPYETTLGRFPCPYLMVCHDIPQEIFRAQKEGGGTLPPGRHLIHRLDSLILYRTLRRARRVFSNSRYVGRWLAEEVGVERGKINLAPCAPGADFSSLTRDLDGDAVRRKWESPQGYILVFSTGDLRENFAVIPQVYRQIIQAGLPHRLLVAGVREEDRPSLEGRLSAYPWRSRVGVVPFLGAGQEKELAGIYAAASVFLDLSLHEGFGMQVIEAMACRTPVVCSNRGALPEVADGAALLVPPLPADEAAAAVVRVISDPELARELVRRGEERASAYSWERTARVIQEALGDEAPPEKGRSGGKAVPFRFPGKAEKVGTTPGIFADRKGMITPSPAKEGKRPSPPSTQPLNILILTPVFPHPGNPAEGIFNEQHARALSKAGARVTVLVGKPWLPEVAARRWTRYHSLFHLPHQEERTGMKILYARYLHIPQFFWAGATLASCLRSLHRAVRTFPAGERFDLIQVHSTWPMGLAAPLLAREMGIPFVLTLHMEDDPRLYGRGGRSLLYRGMLEEASAVVGVGRPLERFLKRVHPDLSLAKSCIIPNGVDHDAVRLISSENGGEANGWGRLVSVGNLWPSKGMDLTLRALSLLRERGTPWVDLTVVGDGPERRSLQKLARKLGIADRVHFKGSLPHEETLREINRGDLFILPSWREAFGVVYLEAMACGKPVIGCFGQGAEDIIRHQIDGLLVAPGRVEDLAEAIGRIVENRDLALRLGRAGSNRAREFTWEQNAAQYLQVYRRVLQEGGPAGGGGK
jgi:teichuronic acid biosynthesis glycosyltransferase TuaC